MGLLRGVLHQGSVSIDALRNAECYIVEMDPNRCILRSQLEQLSSATQTQLCFVAVIGILCRHLKIILHFNLNRFNGPIHFSLHLNFFINWSNIKIFTWCIRQLVNLNYLFDIFNATLSFIFSKSSTMFFSPASSDV